MKHLVKFRYSILSFIFIFLLIEPNAFTGINAVNVAYGVFALAIFIFCCLKYIIKKYRPSIPTIVLSAFRVFLMLITLINHGDIIKVGYDSLKFINILMLCDMARYDGKLNEFLTSMFYVFAILLLINVTTKSFMIENFYRPFLGIRTRCVDYILPLMLSGLLLINKKIKIYKLILIILGFIIGLTNLIIFNVTTGYVALALILITFLLLNIKGFSKVFNNKVLFVGALILIVLITFVRVQVYFNDLIELFTGKDATFTFRTEIWDKSYTLIKDNLIFGHGFINDGDFIPLWGRNWQAHSTILQLTYDSGLFGLILMLAYVLISMWDNKKTTKNYKTIICSAFCFCLLFISIVEIYSYYLIFYFIFAITYNVNKQESNEEIICKSK